MELYLNWPPIKHCSASAAEKKVKRNWHVLAVPDVYWHTYTHQIVHVYKRTCILQSHAVFLALIDPITFSKTANAVPYGEPIEMEIQLFLMDALNNKPVGGKNIFQTNCGSRGERTLC